NLGIYFSNTRFMSEQARNRSGGPNRSNSSNRNRRSGNRGGGGPRRSGSGNRPNRDGKGRPRPSRRKGPPPLTAWEKFVKAITFGAIDPHKSWAKSNRRGKSSQTGSGKNQSRKKASKPREPKPAPAPETITGPRLFIGNLDYATDDEALEELFGAHGDVAEACVIRHGNSGRSKGFAYVEMGDVDQARQAVASLHGQEVLSRKISVEPARTHSREDRKPSRESENRGGESRRERPERSRERRGDRRREDRSRKPARGERALKPLEIEQVETQWIKIEPIDASATEEELGDLFDGVGEFVAHSPLQSGEGDSSQTVEVEMKDTAAAQRAVEFLDMKHFMGLPLRVSGSTAEAFDAASQSAPANPTEADGEIDNEPDGEAEPPAVAAAGD
ncbi:MAG: hypothetical protein AAF236_17340, partial [Verrucomicrobiota bacterium]